MKVMVETSAHHVHVSDADLKALFGEGARLTNKKDLSQPGQFACVEKVEVVGPKGSMSMSILGPTRKETQVEISLTDARKLGVTAPIRESGDLEGTPGCTLKGPAGWRGGQADRVCKGGLQWPQPDLRGRGVPGEPRLCPGHACGYRRVQRGGPAWHGRRGDYPVTLRLPPPRPANARPWGAGHPAVPDAQGSALRFAGRGGLGAQAGMTGGVQRSSRFLCLGAAEI